MFVLPGLRLYYFSLTRNAHLKFPSVAKPCLYTISIVRHNDKFVYRRCANFEVKNISSVKFSRNLILRVVHLNSVKKNYL